MYKKVMLFLLFLSLLGISGFQDPATSAAPGLPLEAQKAFRNGMEAWDQKQWDSAEKYFLEAWEVAPLYPKVLFNLALINEKRDRPVPAVLWFRAYLETSPGAPAAAKVRDEIRRMEARVRTVSEKLLASASAQATLLPDFLAAEKKEAFRKIACVLASLGEIREAVSLARRAGLEETTEDFYLYYYGAHQVLAKNLEGAKKTLSRIGPGRFQNALLAGIIAEELDRDELNAALRLINLLGARDAKTPWLLKIAAYDVQHFETQKAETLFPAFKKPDDQAALLEIVMRGRVQQHQFEMAKRHARKILGIAAKSEGVRKQFLPEAMTVLGKEDEAAELLQQSTAGPTQDSKTLFSMALMLHALGKTEKAEALLREIPKKGSPAGVDYVNAGRARMAADSGDFEQAQTLIEKMPAPWREKLCETLFWKFVWEKHFPLAEKTAALSSEPARQAMLLYELALRSTAKGNLANAVRLTKKSYQIAVAAHSSKVLKKIYQLEKLAGDRAVASKVLLAAGITEWTGLANYFASFESIADLRGYLGEVKTKELAQMPAATAFAAQNWNASLLYIQQSEKKLEKLKGAP